MSKRLKIAPELTLPLEAVTETFGLLAVRGAGKSNAARVMAEEMFDAGLPFVAVDPVGSWRGLRASRDGKGPGLPIPIFGGRWGDVPLERGGGQLIADLVVDQWLTCVLDLTTLDSEASKKTFLLDFARRLYQRNEQPLHLFLEEADDYIPQRPQRDEAQLLRAWENIVRRGRARGLGCTLITQRSASIAKDVLTQVQTLIAMRTTGPQDVAAIASWLKYNAQAGEILEDLARLKAGEAWVWSPVFLGGTSKIRFRVSNTFDSGATPKTGSGVLSSRSVATLADVDLADIQKRMAATIEKAKAEDPRELRKRIAELERDLRTKAAPIPGKATRVEVPVLKDKDTRRLAAVARILERRADQVAKAAAAVAEAAAVVSSAQQDLAQTLKRLTFPPGAPTTPTSGAGRAARPSLPLRPPASAPPGRIERLTAAGGFGLVAQRILDALAELEALDVPEPEKVQVAFLAGYTNLNSKGFSNASGQLRSGGLIAYPGGGMALTAQGRALATRTEGAPRTPQEIQQRVLQLLGGVYARVLRPLIEAYPAALERAELGAQTGYGNLNSKGFTNALGRLRSLGFVDYPDRGAVVAAPVLFLEPRVPFPDKITALEGRRR